MRRQFSMRKLWEYREIGDELDAVYVMKLTNKGRSFIDAWKRGDQEAAVRSLCQS